MSARGTRMLAWCVVAALAMGACSKSSRPTTDAGTSTAPSTEGVRVTSVELGRGVGADKRVTDATRTFSPSDVIYATVNTDGSASSTELKAHWTYQDGQTVNEETRTIAASGPASTEFHISKPDGWPAGTYHLEVFLNGASAGTQDFTVK